MHTPPLFQRLGWEIIICQFLKVKIEAGYGSRTRLTALGRLGTTDIPIPHEYDFITDGHRKQGHKGIMCWVPVISCKIPS